MNLCSHLSYYWSLWHIPSREIVNRGWMLCKGTRLVTHRRHPNSRPGTSSGQCWSRKCILCHSTLNCVQIPAISPDTCTCDALNVSKINLFRHKAWSHHPLSETWMSFSLSCHVRFSVKLIPTRWFFVITLFWMVRIVWVSTRNHATLRETN